MSTIKNLDENSRRSNPPLAKRVSGQMTRLAIPVAGTPGRKSTLQRVLPWGSLSVKALFLQFALPLLASLFCMSQGAFAACDNSTGTTNTTTLTLPSTLVVPRDAAVGAVLLNVPVATTSATAGFSCSTGSTAYLIESMYTTQTTTSLSNVYATNVPGIGIKVIGQNNPSGALPSPPSVYSWATVTTTGYYTFDSWGYQLIKTGAVTAGTLSFSGAVAASWISSSATSNVAPSSRPNLLSSLYINGSTSVVTPTCTTPNVSVVMPTIYQSALKGAGTSAGTTSFNIALNSCPAGMNSIQYEIDPVTTVVSSTDAVVALDGSSTAAGIGVQLLDNDGNPLTAANGFQSAATLGTAPGSGTYNSSTGGDYTIPLKARYYQTGTTVSPGSVSTEMTFTMTYQ
jgi:major type 1 subunit fimbrin (pilin)